MGAWNMQRLQFQTPAVLESFALASFADQRRVGGSREDPSSLEVCLQPTLLALLLTCVDVLPRLKAHCQKASQAHSILLATLNASEPWTTCSLCHQLILRSQPCIKQA